MNSVREDGISIEVGTFDLTCYSNEYKLDLLFYNNINRYGEILRSLVFNSGVKQKDDTTPIKYEPSKLFNNSAIEKLYEINGTSYIWKNMDLEESPLILITDKSYTAVTSYSTFNTSMDYSVPYKNGKYLHDGWYSLISVSLPELPDNSAVAEATLRYSSGKAQYANKLNPIITSDWNDLTTIVATIPIYNFINNTTTHYYDTFDFVAVSKINSLYKELLDNKLEGDWFIKLNSLGPKMKTLETAIEVGANDIAQSIVSSVSDSLLLLII